VKNISIVKFKAKTKEGRDEICRVTDHNNQGFDIRTSANARRIVRAK